jgi:hypothetical protein
MLILSLAAAGGPAVRPAPAQPPQTDGGLREAARRAWGDYEPAARTRSLRARSEFTITDHGRETRFLMEGILVQGNGSCFSFERPDPKEGDLPPESRKRLCEVVGPEYEFTALRPPGSSEWALTSVVDHAALRKAIARGDLPADRRTTRDGIEADYLLIAVSVDGALVSRMIGHACCRTGRFAPVSPQAGAPVEWRFTVDQAKRPAWMQPILTGRVVFDPSQRWVIREYRIDNRNGLGGITTIHRRTTYQPGPGGYPVPAEVRSELVADDKNYRATGVVTFEPVAREAPPADKEFTLSAYGIPEAARAQTHLGLATVAGPPIGKQTAGEPSPTGWYYPLAIAGVVLVAVAVVIRYIRTRRRSVAADVPA